MTRLNNPDAGLVIGWMGASIQNTYGCDGISVYVPCNKLVPNARMTAIAFHECLPGQEDTYMLNWGDVGIVEVNNKPVWANEDHYDLGKGVKPRDQVYAGRGSVTIDLLTDDQRLLEVVDALRKVGFENP